MTWWCRVAAGLLFALALAACDDDRAASAIVPLEPGPEARGHFCGMFVADHTGPKGQAFLTGEDQPIWFSSARDALAFAMLPEELRSIAAIYVNDMARATDWDRPEPGTWIAARDAIYVVGSAARGGMGAAEVVPFGNRAAAERFRDAHGGELYAFADIPQRYVMGDAYAAPAAEAKR